MPRDSVGSLGAEVAAWSERVLGVAFMPWQRLAVDAILSVDAAGKLAARVGLVSCARQQGKTTALTALIGWWLTERAAVRGPQTVLNAAHRLDLATAIFERLAPVFEEEYGATLRRSYGRQGLTMPDGSLWIVRAASPAAGHGYSLDLAVIDEVWNVSEAALDQGIMPSMRARPEPLLSMWSTAGTEESTALIRWRDAGIRAVAEPGALAFLEWSPEPGSAPDDREAWAAANPALGHTITEDTIRAELESPNRSGFLRGSLNMWVAADRGWLPSGLWASLTGKQTMPAGWLAVECRADESRYYVLEACADGADVWVGFAHEARSMAGLWEYLAERLAADRQLVALLAASLDTMVPHEIRRRSQLVGRRELQAYTKTVQALILEGRVTHDGHPELAEHVTRAVIAETPSGLTLSGARSPGPIELARCLVWAVGAAARPARRGRPEIVRSPRTAAR